MRLHKLIATALGIGYIGKGGGTVAAIATCIVWYFAAPLGLVFTVSFTLLTTILGVWSGNVVEAEWGKDNKKVVMDEVSGMCVSLVFLPYDLSVILVGLVLFRFFDIAKPLFIRKTEALPGGWGVMMDDILSGIYANILLQIAVMLGWL